MTEELTEVIRKLKSTVNQTSGQVAGPILGGKKTHAYIAVQHDEPRQGSYPTSVPNPCNRPWQQSSPCVRSRMWRLSPGSRDSPVGRNRRGSRRSWAGRGGGLLGRSASPSACRRSSACCRRRLGPTDHLPRTKDGTMGFRVQPRIEGVHVSNS